VRNKRRAEKAGTFRGKDGSERGGKRVRTNNSAKSVSGNTGITDKSGKEAKRTLTGIVAGLPRAASRGEAYTARFPFFPSRPPASCGGLAATIGRFSAFALRTHKCNGRGQARFVRAQFAFSRAQAGPSRPQRASSRRQNAPARRQFARVRLELGRERSNFSYNRCARANKRRPTTGPRARQTANSPRQRRRAPRFRCCRR
jgi:hypothetical protein